MNLEEFLFELLKTVNLGFDWAYDQKGKVHLAFLEGDQSKEGLWHEYQGKKDAFRAVMMVMQQNRDIPEVQAALSGFSERYSVSALIDTRTGVPPDNSGWKDYVNTAIRMLGLAEAALSDSNFGSVSVSKLGAVLVAVRDSIEMALKVGG